MSNQKQFKPSLGSIVSVNPSHFKDCDPPLSYSDYNLFKIVVINYHPHNNIEYMIIQKATLDGTLIDDEHKNRNILKEYLIEPRLIIYDEETIF